MEAETQLGGPLSGDMPQADPTLTVPGFSMFPAEDVFIRISNRIK